MPDDRIKPPSIRIIRKGIRIKRKTAHLSDKSLKEIADSTAPKRPVKETDALSEEHDEE